MDFTAQVKRALEAQGSTSSTPKVVVKEKKNGDSQQLQKIIEILAKLTLSNTLQVRIMKSCLIQCWKVKADSPVCEVAKKSVASYIENQNKLKETMTIDKIKDIMGNPNNAVLNGLFHEVLNSPKVETDVKGKLETIIKAWGNDWKLLQKEVPYLKVCKTFHSDTKRVEIHLPYLGHYEKDPAKWEGSVTHAWVLIQPIVLAGAQPLPGQAPPGDLERQLQAYLDKMQEE